MIFPTSLLIALAAAQAPVSAAPPPEQTRFKECTTLVQSDAEKAVAAATDWRIRGGGLWARQCLGLAYVQLGRWAPAATAFEQAARDAETAGDPRRSDFWVQSGNAWLAADEGLKARSAFDAALATTSLTPELRGEVHLDRARAGVALGDLASARADIDKGLELVPRDPFAWYLSAGLALREGNMAKANADIARAVELAPDSADVLLTAGTIAGTSGDV
ncbi:MAG TPA: tetratricopeptide repeat protein, partial [Allosphingosinicella sp.]|nr:tetratricopeptide repeat protein [Allosphingosinicella sp.]